MQYVATIVESVLYCIVCRYCIHQLQLVSYKPLRGYFDVLFGRYFLMLCMVQVLLFGIVMIPWQYNYLLDCVVLAIACVIPLKASTKLPLAYTQRVKRLMVTIFVLCYVLSLLLPLFLLPIFLPFLVLLALAVNMPIELCISRHFVKRAMVKLSQYNGTVIAITGSYGKTSVKNMVATLLEGAIATPSSYNTEQGIATFINNTDIHQYRYIVLEFGARKKGDIARLCQLYHPTVGVITGIAQCHLSTMKSIDNIIATKQELAMYLGEQDILVVNGNDSTVACWGNIGKAHNIVSTEVVKLASSHLTLHGSTLQLDIYSKHEVFFPLVGYAHIDNLLLAIAVCIALQQSIDITLDNIVKVSPIPHRMQLIEGVVPIIDDSYNCNLYGIQKCCDTMTQLDIATKIVIAQGIVECGDSCQLLNRQVGELLAKTFDHAIFCGINSKYLLEGVSDNNNCHVTSTLSQAVQVASQYYTDNCVVVITNDIP